MVYDRMLNRWILVFERLHGRHDIADVLRDIIAKHALDSSLLQLQENSASNTESSICVIVWIKVIFDLQRTYLQACAGVNECPPYLLPCLIPSELVFSTITYLIQVKLRLFPNQTNIITREFAKQRYFIAQTLLSGLRLLLLRNEGFHPQKKSLLQSTISAAWQQGRFCEAEQFVVSEVFSEVLDLIRPIECPNEHFHPLEPTNWSKANLPTFSAGLYPLDIRPEKFVPDVLISLAEENAEWIQSYWILFDVLWAAEFAIVQRHLDRRRKSNTTSFTSESLSETDETLEQLKKCRANLKAAIFQQSLPDEKSPRPGLIESLTSTLLDWHGQETMVSPVLKQNSLPSHYMRTGRLKTSDYGKHLMDMRSVLEKSLGDFADWLQHRKVAFQHDRIGAHLPSLKLHQIVKNWVDSTSAKNIENQMGELEGQLTPIYIVNCPALHPVPKKLLEYKLRWCDKWAYERLQDNPPFLDWKEGVSCPRCAADTKIKCARLSEPLEEVSNLLEHSTLCDYNLSQYAVGDSLSSETTSLSESGSSPMSPSTKPSVLEFPMSPYAESLNVPIPIPRIMDLPIPVSPLNGSLDPPSSRSDLTGSRTSSTGSAWSIASPSNTKSHSRTFRLKNSLRKRPNKPKDIAHLPQSPSFAFSASGYSIIVWGKGNDFLVRFDIPSNEALPIQGCKYDLAGIEAAAAGNHRCAIIATTRERRSLVVFNGTKTTPEAQIKLDSSVRNVQVSISVSRNDKYAATSINDQLQVYQLGSSGIRKITFHKQIQVHQLEGGQIQQRSTPVNRAINQTDCTNSLADSDLSRTDTGRFGASKALSLKETAEEAQRQSAIVDRKLSFSLNDKLAVATHLGDHRVYIDVWDCIREPVSTISENPRSFRLPPFTLNDGGLTTVFYDSSHRSAIFTAFLSKEYPVLIPFPGYEELQNEEFGTKIVHAAQSPSGSIFAVANSMTEIIQLEYTPKGTLSPRRLKRGASKISSTAFKPGCIALAMPQESVIQAFWIKDAKLMLRTIKVVDGETFRDYDIRPHYDRIFLERARDTAQAPALRIPEPTSQ